MLFEARMYTECEAICTDLFDHAVLSMGPRSAQTRSALSALWELLTSAQKGRRADAAALKARAAKLGCDVSAAALDAPSLGLGRYVKGYTKK